MTNEHNPIAQLITKIQQKWAEEVTAYPDVKFVRWLIDPDESQLYEGFLRLESTPHGRVNDILITLLTPFDTKETYTRDLINAWFDAIANDKKTFEQLATEGRPFIWNEKYYKDKASLVNGNAEELLLEILSTFHAAFQMPDRPLTLALFQYSITSPSEFGKWIKKLAGYEIPENVRFCIFDLKTERFYDRLFSSFEPGFTKTLMVDLNLAAAIKKVIQSGDPNDPGVRLQKYIQTMSESLAEKDPAKLDRIGKVCIEDMARSKIRSLMATAHIVYAGMLFHFKKYEVIEGILKAGLRIADAGKAQGDATCQALITQFYSFMAANYQLQKRYKEAIDWFCKSAEHSLETKQTLPAISAYRQASFIEKKHDSYRYAQILAKGYVAGEELKKEELTHTDYGFVCLDYYEHLYHNRENEKSNSVDERMKRIFGENWKQEIREASIIHHEKVAV